MTQCPNEPCLFRLVYETHECFLLIYVDDALITGQPKAVQYLQTKLSEHFECRFIRDILLFWGNTHNTYYIYTDNQASEHVVSQPTLNKHSRAIDIRHHAVRQAYLEGDVKVGGVVTTGNHSEFLPNFWHHPYTRHTPPSLIYTRKHKTHGNNSNNTSTPPH
jgi:hypothetical protein